MIKTCPACGTEFKQRRAGMTYCCDECRHKAANIRKREAYSSYRMAAKKKKSPGIQPGMSIAEVAKLAKDAGMTYGQFVARGNNNAV